jgi:hypothetical protein
MPSGDSASGDVGDEIGESSDRSATCSPLTKPDVEFRGLSVLPRILEPKEERNDRVDSLVSALLKEGYDWRLSLSDAWDAPPLGEFAPEPLEGWFPIFTGSVQYPHYRIFER